MDRYDERLIKSKPGADAYIFMGMSILVTLMGILLILTFWALPIGILLLALGIFMITKAVKGLSVEYEFILTNGDIDISKIKGKSKRVELGTIEADNITIMDRADSDYVKNDVSRRAVKIRKFTGPDNPEGNIAIYVGDDNDKRLFLFDFDDKCTEHMKAVLKTKSRI
ncbi:MAG: DUF6106 family protein [Eubacterium sp.]|nr:DUF6106 family protein [Eubacterium sp.]